MKKIIAKVLFIYCFTCIYVRGSKVSLEDNQYSNILVAISPDVASQDADKIITSIKMLFREASPVLYRATRGRAYFANIHILIPNTWNNIEANISSWQIYDKADVRVVPSTDQDTPYTVQLGECKEPGEYIHLTSNYVLNAAEAESRAKYGPAGKVLVHEWAHLRYGVFDEYGSAGDPDFPLFYRPPGSKTTILPNVCSDADPVFETRDITDNGPCRIDPATKLYDKNCRFQFLDTFKPTTSLASYHNIPSVVHFCNSDQMSHKIHTPNKHNRKCAKRSVWSVIEEHQDFAGGRNPPVDLSRMDMSFEIVRPRGARFVLVADVSGSMRLCNRIGKLVQSARRWILHDLPPGSELGLVQFSETAQVLSELETIVDLNSRLDLMSKVPHETFSATCIGCGLELAAKMLQNGGGTILLISDGQNSPGYCNINDALSSIVENDIRVVSIALGVQADNNIEKLADLTDGKSYFVPDDESSEAIVTAFNGALTYQPSVSMKDLKIKLVEDNYKSGDIQGEFTVDESVGQNLMISVLNLENADVKSILLRGPSDDDFQSYNFTFDWNVALVKIDAAEAGIWKYSISTNLSAPWSVDVVVTTQMKPNVTAPITTKCWVFNGADIHDASSVKIKIFAQVAKGDKPVVGANVRAYVEKPGDEVEVINLQDTGVGADSNRNDGIYSRYFPNATEPGRYSVKCQVWDDGSAYVTNGFIGSSIAVSSDGYNPDDRVPTGHFTRVESGGSFRVEIPVSREDAYPPCAISDLSVQIVDNMTVVLQWTAPGDELDSGKVSYYIVKYSDKAEDLLDEHFDQVDEGMTLSDADIVDGSLNPVDAGMHQSAKADLQQRAKIDVTYYLALRAIDKARKMSAVSNIAAFYLSNEQQVQVFNVVVRKGGVPTLDIGSTATAYYVTWVVIGGGLIVAALLIAKRLMVRSKYDNVPV